MNPPRPFLAAALMISITGAISVAHAGWPNDPGVNVQIAPSSNMQGPPSVVPDGEGGAFFVWTEIGGGYRIRAQHLTASGALAPGWPAGGIDICVESADRGLYHAVPDGFGGFIAVWQDYRNSFTSHTYVQRVNSNGTVAWTANGVSATATVYGQYQARVCADRTGGAVVVWFDVRNPSDWDIYAQRISSAGSRLWDADGKQVCAAATNQDNPKIINDGTAGGSMMVWTDPRNGNNDIYGMRLDANGNTRPNWTVNGSGLVVQALDQWKPLLLSDGNFGTFMAWRDQRSGSYDIYLNRLDLNGFAVGGGSWVSGGIALTSDPGYQEPDAIITDAAGGVIVVWQGQGVSGFDIFAQRVSGSGTVAWTPGGVSLVSAYDSQYSSTAVPDGAGGAVVAWQDYRSSSQPLLYAQRINASGTVVAGWATDGIPVANAHWVQWSTGCSDGNGGLIMCWQHNGSPQQVYAQRIDRWGYLGAQARIVDVRDVPNDQGGRVKVTWDRSPIDAYPENGVATYQVFRSVPPQSAFEAIQRGEAAVAARPEQTGAKRWLLTTEFAAATYYWELVGSVSAYQLPGYSYIAPTLGDSVGGSNPMTLFMIRAQNSDGSRFWPSDPDSGYSTDDLAPAAPAPFTGAYSAGATHLHWGPNSEPDLGNYRLYRGSSPGFVPGPGNMIAAPPDTGYADVGPAGSHYKLSAVDSHGNEGPFSLLAPGGTVDVPGRPVHWTLSLAPAVPNPSAGPTSWRFTLPAAGAARMTIHDAAGRLVRVVVDGWQPAGEHAARWGGEDEGGRRTPGGLYFARLSFSGRTLLAKLVRIE